MNCWQENPISYESKRFTQFKLQWRFRCTRLKGLLQQNKGNLWWAWIEPNKRQQNDRMLIVRGPKSHRSTKSIRWHLLNVSFSINSPNIIIANSCRKLGIMQPVPAAHSPNTLPKWRLLQMERFTGRQTQPLTCVWNFRSGYPMLRQKPSPAATVSNGSR